MSNPKLHQNPMQERYGYAKDQTERQVDEWLKKTD
jgi:uncharacterized protein YjbJ (UPF0337 family)